MRRVFFICLLFPLLILTGTTAASPPPQSALPAYTRDLGISGNLTSIGSDTLNNLMALWAETFNHYYPGVNIQIQGVGSATAPPALIEGTALFAPMSRPMRHHELAAFERRHGYAPLQLPVAVDRLAIFVHQDNPLPGLTLAELDGLFSATRRRHPAPAITHWGQLGLEGSWNSRDIALFSRNAVSGTYGFFKERVLLGGDFRTSINEQPGSAAVVQSVASSLNGIGYAGVGYLNAGVRAVPLAEQAQGPFLLPTDDSADYPLSRQLYLYVNKPPQQPLSPLAREFINMIYSREGQEAVLRDGYLPLPLEQVLQLRRELGLDG